MELSGAALAEGPAGAQPLGQLEGQREGGQGVLWMLAGCRGGGIGFCSHQDGKVEAGE